MLQFNETTANLNYSATAIPWIAYVSCDSAIQTATVPSAVNTTASPANTTSTAANETTPAFNLLQQAQDLGAAAVLLFSSRAQVRPDKTDVAVPLLGPWADLSYLSPPKRAVLHVERDLVLRKRFDGGERHLADFFTGCDKLDRSDLLDRIAAGGQYHFATVRVRRLILERSNRSPWIGSD